jgi:hypothetical protein
MPGFSKSILAKRVQGSFFDVVDDVGNGLSGVTITTSANANISLTYNTGSNLTYLLPRGQQVITATKAGYVTKKTAVNISGVVHVTIVLASTTDIQSTHTINNADINSLTVTNTARAENNATVDFPAGAIVDDSGNPVSDVTVQITNVSISDTGSVNTFPGLFVGNDAGTIEPIESFGFMNVTLTDTATGDELTLDPAKGATVRLPVDPDPDVDTIPTYRLDESTGQWILSDYAYRITGSNVFEFKVDTFSWWNLDQVPQDQCFPLEFTIHANEDDGSTPNVGDDSTSYSQTSQPGVSLVPGVTVYAQTSRQSPARMGQGISNAQGVGTIECMPGGLLYVYGIKGTTYYTPSFAYFDGTTIRYTLRPNGTVPIPGVATTTTATTVYADGPVTVGYTVSGADDNSADYVITGVDSADIGGAPLTGQCNLTLENPFPWPDIPQLRVRRGTLLLNMIQNMSGADKTMTVTLTTPSGQTSSRSVTLKNMLTHSMRAGLTVVGLGVDGTSYITANGEVTPFTAGHQIRFTLATRNLANQSIPYTITGVSSSDISGAPLSGNFTVVNGNPTSTQSLSDLVLTVSAGMNTFKTLYLEVTFADSTTASTFAYLNMGGGGPPP